MDLGNNKRDQNLTAEEEGEGEKERVSVYRLNPTNSCNSNRQEIGIEIVSEDEDEDKSQEEEEEEVNVMEVKLELKATTDEGNRLVDEKLSTCSIPSYSIPNIDSAFKKNDREEDGKNTQGKTAASASAIIMKSSEIIRKYNSPTTGESKSSSQQVEEVQMPKDSSTNNSSSTSTFSSSSNNNNNNNNENKHTKINVASYNLNMRTVNGIVEPYSSAPKKAIIAEKHDVIFHTAAGRTTNELSGFTAPAPFSSKHRHAYKKRPPPLQIANLKMNPGPVDFSASSSANSTPIIPTKTMGMSILPNFTAKPLIYQLPRSQSLLGERSNSLKNLDSYSNKQRRSSASSAVVGLGSGSRSGALVTSATVGNKLYSINTVQHRLSPNTSAVSSRESSQEKDSFRLKRQASSTSARSTGIQSPMGSISRLNIPESRPSSIKSNKSGKRAGFGGPSSGVPGLEPMPRTSYYKECRSNSFAFSRDPGSFDDVPFKDLPPKERRHRKVGYAIMAGSTILLLLAILFIIISLHSSSSTNERLRKENEELIRRNVIQQTQLNQSNNNMSLLSTIAADLNNTNNSHNNITNTQSLLSSSSNSNSNSIGGSNGGNGSPPPSSSFTASSIVSSDLFLDINNNNKASSKEEQSSYSFKPSRIDNRFLTHPGLMPPTSASILSPTPESYGSINTTTSPLILSNTNSNNTLASSNRNKKNSRGTKMTTSVISKSASPSGKRLAAMVAVPERKPDQQQPAESQDKNFNN